MPARARSAAECLRRGWAVGTEARRRGRVVGSRSLQKSNALHYDPFGNPIIFAMTERWISEEPSPISQSFTSRYMRSTG